MAFTEDLSAFVDVDEFAVPVTINGSTGTGILDQNSDMVMGGELVIVNHVLTALTSFAGSLSYGDSITVDGNGYRVEMEPLRIDDGAFCRVPLVLAAVAVFRLLLEDGYLLLLETGDALLLE